MNDKELRRLSYLATRVEWHGDWTQGRLLPTAQVRKWSRQQREHTESVERCIVYRIYRRFCAGDDGRSRAPVATCYDPDTAAYIAAAQPSVVQYLVTRERLKRGSLRAAFMRGFACACFAVAVVIFATRAMVMP
jgi:hypothetical protein